MSDRIKKLLILFVKLLAITECLAYGISNCFIVADTLPLEHGPIIAFIVLIVLALYQKKSNFQIKNKKAAITQLTATILLAFFVIDLRSSLLWAAKTFPVTDANAVILTLEMPFDTFAYSMVRKYLASTIPYSLITAILLTVLLYTLLSSFKRRLLPITIYFMATVGMFIHDIPIMDYIYILNGEAEKASTYSPFFEQNYIHPDSVKITPPDQKRNLILIYLESMENSFSELGLTPEITELAKENINFGKTGDHIGGGYDAIGSNHTFGATATRTMGVPLVTLYNTTPAYKRYKSLYKILDEQKYHQIFFQGNFGLFEQFEDFFIEQSVKEIYGPDDLIERLNLNREEIIQRHGMKTVQDKDAFIFAEQILDTISEPFTLTFFTIDTHSPNGIYDPDCIKASDESKEDEILKATARCVSMHLGKFLDFVKTKPYYQNTSIIITGDHLFMGDRVVKNNPDRKWIDIFINAAKTPSKGEKRLFTDIDMNPTILSAMGFSIEGDRLGLGTDLFSEKNTLFEDLGADSLNKEIKKLAGHYSYEKYKYLKQ